MSIAGLGQDLRHTLRTGARTKAATTALLLSLALGTGVNAVVHGVLGALLLRAPEGLDDPRRLVSIYTSEFSEAAYGPSSYPDYLSVKSSAASFTSIAAVDDSAVENVALAAEHPGDAGRSVRVAAVSDDFFSTLGTRADAGRLWPSTGVPPAADAAVVSLSLAEALGGEAVVGRMLRVGSRQYTIAGIAPARFRGLTSGRECDVWIAIGPAPTARGDRRLSIIARLRPALSVEQAADDLRHVSDDLAARHPETNRGSMANPGAPRRITPVQYSHLDPATGAQIILIRVISGGASALLLASACLNAGSLLLSRSVSRRHELAVKMALGATRGRLVRQLLTETLCLSLAGGALGLLFAAWTAGAIPALFMADQAALLDTRPDAQLILLTIGVAGAAGALFGIAPALYGTASGAVTALRADAGSVSAQSGGARLRNLLVGSQLALSTVLLLATGLLVVSLSHALQGDIGARAGRVAVASIDLPGRWADPVRGVAYRNRLLSLVSQLDGVQAVGWASALPLGRERRKLFRVNADTSNTVDSIEFDTNVVSPGYFAALSLPCVEGRLFDDGDRMLAAPVVIVDELLARRYFGPAATGRELVDDEGERLRIVGVVRTGRYRTLQQPAQPTVYYPSSQDYLPRGHLVARTARDPAALLGGLERAVKSAGEPERILQIVTLEGHLSRALALDRVATSLVGLCGLIALAMSAIGVYGVMIDAVRRRTREIGLRIALGAGRMQVARLVLREAAVLAAAGLLAGAAVALAIGHAARSFVPGIPPLDAVTLAAAAGGLAVVVAAAAVVPLRSALRVNPNIALRTD